MQGFRKHWKEGGEEGLLGTSGPTVVHRQDVVPWERWPSAVSLAPASWAHTTKAKSQYLHPFTGTSESPALATCSGKDGALEEDHLPLQPLKSH